MPYFSWVTENSNSTIVIEVAEEITKGPAIAGFCHPSSKTRRRNCRPRLAVRRRQSLQRSPAPGQRKDRLHHCEGSIEDRTCNTTRRKVCSGFSSGQVKVGLTYPVICKCPVQQHGDFSVWSQQSHTDNRIWPRSTAEIVFVISWWSGLQSEIRLCLLTRCKQIYISATRDSLRKVIHRSSPWRTEIWNFAMVPKFDIEKFNDKNDFSILRMHCWFRMGCRKHWREKLSNTRWLRPTRALYGGIQSCWIWSNICTVFFLP